jgi:hypothetical protein
MQDLLDLMTTNYDITSLGKVGIPSTYLYVQDFTCILSISQLNANAVIDQIFESALGHPPTPF